MQSIILIFHQRLPHTFGSAKIPRDLLWQRIRLMSLYQHLGVRALLVQIEVRKRQLLRLLPVEGDVVQGRATLRFSRSTPVHVMLEYIELRDVRVVAEAVLGRDLDGCYGVFTDGEDICFYDEEGPDLF
ncbi:hypothetical protein NUW58_g3724 [Xylaria curta]|uniref:Uncharacterized protein n=1 Tax=Xylaria curta TaxID=42375 RepID=A0ACC1PCC9_9PEZI|nr:hypothetical protein NUW58_g3724 [Xylaria curta]